MNKQVFSKFNKQALMGALAVVAAGAARADGEATAAFTAAVGSATTNVTSFGVALVALSAVGVAFMIAIKYVKKIRSAA